MTNKKQTAVEWLQEQIETQRMQCNNEWQCGYQKALNEVIFLLTQAKAMEKEQMIEFGFDTYCFISGIMKVPFEQISENKLNAEHNYKETYEQ